MSRELARFPIQLLRSDQIAPTMRDDRAAIRNVRFAGAIADFLCNLGAPIVQPLRLRGVTAITVCGSLPAKNVDEHFAPLAAQRRERTIVPAERFRRRSSLRRTSALGECSRLCEGIPQLICDQHETSHDRGCRIGVHRPAGSIAARSCCQPRRRRYRRSPTIRCTPRSDKCRSWRRRN